ncbi:MAG: PTS sugar transporter subunit IIA [Erysipelothrix sp.]
MKIDKKQIRFNVSSSPKDTSIRLAGQVLLENGFITEEYIESMIKKEETDVTYIGNGIAIPHGLYEDKKYVLKSGISIIHYPEGIEYDENFVFLVIGIAANDENHLEILQEIAIKLSDESYVEKLVSSEDMDTFVDCFNE